MTTSVSSPSAPPTRRPHADAPTRRAQILRATTVLISRHGPKALSIRQIAAEADVNHALIYRHFRDRASLVGEAISTEMADWAQVVTDADDPEAAIADGFAHLTARPHVAGALAQAVTSHQPAGQATFPVVDAYIAQLTRAGADERVAAQTATALVALMTGWMTAEPFWVAAGRNRGNEGRAEARAGLARQLDALLAAALP